ncbi:hypothetical protein Taro_038609 [Colocasia esculenta]|uniref:ATP-dependent RNA helicase n=1 Tax=Colocasia esculenta TaxID=4460 RepID=A0A843WDB3_COLES|nr:hypothetical protein [Colocasia esculenta]
MPGQLLPLRLFGSSSGLLGSTRSLSILSRAFPFKLKYSLLCPGQPSRLGDWCAGAGGVRALSGRSAGGRGGRLRDSRRGDFRAGSVGQGRSLMEEEAELSDWVSELKTDSFRVGVGRESDDAGGYGGGKTRSGERGRGGVRGRFRDGRSSIRAELGSESDDGRKSDDVGGYGGAKTRSRERGRDRGGARGRFRNGRSSFRAEQGSESDDASEFTYSRESIRERARGRDGDGVRVRDRRERGRDLQPSQGRYGIPSREGRRSEPEGFDSFFERRHTRAVDRPSRGSDRPSRVSDRPSRRMELASDLGEEEEDMDFGSRKRGRGGIGGRPTSSSLEKRGRKDFDLSRARSGGGSRISFEISDEEENADDDDEEEEAVSGSEDGFLSKVEDREEIVVPGGFDRTHSSEEQGDAPSKPSASEGAESYLSQTRFDQCSLSPLSLKGIKAAGYERMTMVQEATLPVILKGKDVLAKAKTGTGKTVAFLLPAIEVITKLLPVDRDQKRPPIDVLVICPTRELANQAAKEANTLLKFHPAIGVQVVIGGTRLALEQKNMQANPCQILVATPGRLRDHIENTPGFATRLKGVKVLVLDEADHLLDMGFRKDIENIIAAVPKQRQTLLFSATVPDEVLVFCTTAMVTKLVADLLSELNLNVREIHSRKPQSYRTRVSEEFRKLKGLILVSSDVSARGVDYPDVTLVIQVGVPADREQYIHRLGRTGRKGKEGKGMLLLAPWEEFFLSSIQDLPISKAPLPLIDPDTRKKVERALSHVEMKNKEAAYQSWLGYYNSNKNIGRDKGRLVALANEFSRGMGLDNPPAISKLVLGKMGLRNVPGLRAK